MNWKTACKIAAPAAACAGAFAFLVAPGHATRAQKAPFLYRNYAHRGLHTEDGTVPENSLPAFRAAAEAGYAVEMDVHLTAGRPARRVPRRYARAHVRRAGRDR